MSGDDCTRPGTATARSTLDGKAPPHTCACHATIVPNGPDRWPDAEVTLAVQNDGQLNRLCRNVLGWSALADDRRFATSELRVHAPEALERLIEEALLPLRRYVAKERSGDGDVPFASRGAVANLVTHPKFAARARWVGVATPGGDMRGVVSPSHMGRAAPPMGAVPWLDENGQQIRCEARG